MARMRSDDVLRHSIIDRLSDPPGGLGDLRIGIPELRDSIRRDLEWLLNTRRLLESDSDTQPESSRSILAYGLPDLSPFSQSSHGDRGDLCKMIAHAVRTFETRLDPASVQVEHVTPEDPYDFRMHFRITGVIHVEPIREPIRFDTTIDPDTGAMKVEEPADA